MEWEMCGGKQTNWSGDGNCRQRGENAFKTLSDKSQIKNLCGINRELKPSNPASHLLPPTPPPAFFLSNQFWLLFANADQLWNVCPQTLRPSSLRFTLAGRAVAALINLDIELTPVSMALHRPNLLLLKLITLGELNICKCDKRETKRRR